MIVCIQIITKIGGLAFNEAGTFEDTPPNFEIGNLRITNIGFSVDIHPHLTRCKLRAPVHFQSRRTTSQIKSLQQSQINYEFSVFTG